MSAHFSFVETDIDGEGKRWRLMVDSGEFLTLADEDFTVPRSQIEENGDRIVGPFTVGQLLEAAQTLRHGNLGGPHCPAKAGALRSPQ